MIKRIILTNTHLIWLSLFYFIAVIFLFVISIWSIRDYQLSPDLNFENYGTIISNPLYYNSLFLSFKVSFIVGFFSILFAVPFSYINFVFVNKKYQLLLVFLMFIPFFSSIIIRMFSWQNWINKTGIINYILVKIGFGQIDIIYTETAIYIGLVSYLLPIASLIIYLNIIKIDKDILSAAKNLGASSFRVFKDIVFPAILPGVFLAFLFSFIIAFGDFVTSSILGGNNVYTLSLLVNDRVKISDWPMAAALSVIMLFFLSFIITIIYSLLKKFET